MNNVGKSGLIPGLVFLVLTVLANPLAAQEDYATWSGQRNITLNTRASGANVPGNVLNYPLLVRLDSANASAIFNAALPGGVDIRFSKPSGVRLPFERERWDAAARKAEFWVLMDTVKGNDSGTALRIHWGKAGAPDSSRNQAVFSPSNGFLAVWHLNETLGASGDTIANATGPNHKGTVDLTAGAGVTVPANTTTGIGVGKNFGGNFDVGTINTTGAFFLVSNQGSALNLNTDTGPFTISAWANPAVCDNTTRIALISKYGDVNSGPEGARAWALQTGNVTAGYWRLTVNPLAFSGASTTSAQTEYVTNAPCTENQWTYLAGSYNSNGNAPTQNAAGAQNNKLYRNGASGEALVTGATGGQQPVSIGNSADVYIGRIMVGGTGGVRYFRGGMDEIRISNVERSANWNKLDYEIQKTGSSAIFVGSPPVAVRPGARTPSGFSVHASGSSVRILFPAGLSETRVSVRDLAGREVWAGVAAAGARALVWEGVTFSGAPAAAGGYVVRVAAGTGRAMESKVVLLR